VNSDEACPACGARATRETERVPVDRVADLWAEQPFVRERFDAATVRAQVRADLGTDEVRIVHCAACGLEHAAPMRTWRADHYPVQDHGFGFDHEMALRRLRGGDRGRLLEIGCADGAFLDRVAAIGYAGIGVDFAPASVAAARAAGRDVRAVGVDSLAGAVADAAPFDVIAMFQIIEHLEQPDETFGQLAAVARPGTRLIVGCPSTRRYARAYSNHERVGLSEFWDYPPQHTLRWTPKALRIFLARHGWHVGYVKAEPFQLIGAAAQLAAMDGIPAGWYAHGFRRRIETARRIASMALTFAPVRCTGIRLYAEATFRGRSTTP
jgi:2-polyprenyl-3-methyl-5-hydroxy-6-metoxy-1,4-benzoquinol methylase